MPAADRDLFDDRPARPPAGAVVALALLLLLAPVAFAAGGDDPVPRNSTGPSLADVARRAGCRLTEFQDGMRTNPPVTGRFVERAQAADGSYAGRTPPSLDDTIHAMFHGRVLFQYRPGLSPADLRALDRLTRQDPDKVLLFENQTGMRANIAATAYLSVMTCPRVNSHVLRALDAFRARRRGFGQSF